MQLGSPEKYRKNFEELFLPFNMHEKPQNLRKGKSVFTQITTTESSVSPNSERRPCLKPNKRKREKKTCSFSNTTRISSTTSSMRPNP
jgi:hypothetical protein